MISTTSMRRSSPFFRSDKRLRDGFTLIELLVATTVFIIGFTSAFGLFLAAMRFRTLGDDTVKLSLASSSLVAELAIGNPAVVATPKPPSDYLGSGDLPITPAPSLPKDPTRFFPYAGVPGSWYTVETCTDVSGKTDNAETPTLPLNLLVVMYPQADLASGLSFKDIYRRMRLDILPVPADIDNLTADELRRMSDELVKRGVAMRVSAVVVRRPSWMN